MAAPLCKPSHRRGFFLRLSFRGNASHRSRRADSLRGHGRRTELQTRNCSRSNRRGVKRMTAPHRIEAKNDRRRQRRRSFRPDLNDCVLENRVSPVVANLGVIILTTGGYAHFDSFSGCARPADQSGRQFRSPRSRQCKWHTCQHAAFSHRLGGNFELPARQHHRFCEPCPRCSDRFVGKPCAHNQRRLRRRASGRSKHPARHP